MEQLKEETDDALLLLPRQLQKLLIWDCPELSLRADSPYGGKGGSLQALSSLHSLYIVGCPKFLACYLPSPSSSGFPFPTSLQSLCLSGVEKLAPLSNLASLVNLQIKDCGGSEGADLWRLLAHGCLRKLPVTVTPNLFSIECCSEDTLEPSSPSSKLQSLHTDDVAGVLAAPICTLLSSSLTSLSLWLDEEMERFTKEQEQALQLLTSLQELDLLVCDKLQCLPAGLQRLTNLKRLLILGSPAIHSLHKDGLPDSLQELEIRHGDIRSLPKDGLPNSLRKLKISNCSAIRSLPKDGLPNSLEELVIYNCPSIRSLPKGGLPSSLRLLNVSSGIDSNSEELRRQCRTLIGTIPIVRL